MNDQNVREFSDYEDALLGFFRDLYRMKQETVLEMAKLEPCVVSGVATLTAICGPCYRPMSQGDYDSCLLTVGRALQALNMCAFHGGKVLSANYQFDVNNYSLPECTKNSLLAPYLRASTSPRDWNLRKNTAVESAPTPMELTETLACLVNLTKKNLDYLHLSEVPGSYVGEFQLLSFDSIACVCDEDFVGGNNEDSKLLYPYLVDVDLCKITRPTGDYFDYGNLLQAMNAATRKPGG